MRVEVSEEVVPGSQTDEDGRGVEPGGDRRGRAFLTALGLIALLGLAWRVTYVLLMRNQPLFPDSLGYHFRAQDLADGKGFVLPVRQVLGLDVENPPDAGVPPGWSLVLTVPTRLGLRSVLSQQLVVCVIGTATIVMAGLAGRRAFGHRVGLIAAGIVALYPNTWLYERELLSEPLTALLVATMIWVAYGFLSTPTTGLALALGVVLGALAMTRAEQIVLAALLVLPLIISARGIPLGRRVTWLALAGTATVMVIAPWTAYNWDRFEQPVVLSTGLGSAMRAGNCERTYHGDLLGYTELHFIEVSDESGCGLVGRSYASDQTVVDDQLRQAAVEFMGGNLDRVPVVVAARIGRTFSAFRPFQQVHLEAARETPVPVLRLALAAFWVLVPLAVLGAVVARRRRIRIYPLVSFFVVVVLAVSMTIGAVRYRSPAEIPLALLAAVGIEHLLNRRGGAKPMENTGEPQVTTGYPA